MRSGIFGGTFNPVHRAHLEIAEAVRRHCRLDRIIFLPAAVPPHKPIAAAVSFRERLAMARLAVEECRGFEVSDLEAERSGTSFSVDTLEELHRLFPGDDFFFIIGADSFHDIATWKDYPRLFGLANIVVVGRPGSPPGALQEFLPVAIKNDFCYDEKSSNLRYKSGHELIFVGGPQLDISSTMVRRAVAAGDDISHLVPAAVADYIDRNGLYRDNQKD